MKNKREFFRKISLLLVAGYFCIFGGVLWGSGEGLRPILRTALNPERQTVILDWDSDRRAAGYRVYRQLLAEPFGEEALLAQLDQDMTRFEEDVAIGISALYRVEVMKKSGGSFSLSAAVKMVINGFERLIPVAIDFYPNTVQSALSSLKGYERVTDANSGEILADSAPLRAGMVLDVAGAKNHDITLVGLVAEKAQVRMKARSLNYLAIPYSKFFHRDGKHPTLNDWKSSGLSGDISLALVYSDYNMEQISSEAPLITGQIYSLTLDRQTDLNLISMTCRQEAEIVPDSIMSRPLLGGSPDDGTKCVVLYDIAYNTKLYKCWSNGKSGAWDGVTDNAGGADNVKNAAVVRLGSTVYVRDEAGMTASTPVTVWYPSAPGIARQPAGWSVSWNSTKQAAAIVIPAGEPIGDYQVQIGAVRENYVTLYVIFDPAWSLSALSSQEYEGWAYKDIDWATVEEKKEYLNYALYGPIVSVTDSEVSAFRGEYRSTNGADSGVFGQRCVEIAASIHGNGVRTPLEAAVHVYEIVGQRLTWTSNPIWGMGGGTVNTFENILKGQVVPMSGSTVTATELDVVTAEKAALGLGWSNRFPSAYVIKAGQCMNFGACQTVWNRALGIPARTTKCIYGAGWSNSYHVWNEVALQNPDIKPADPKWWQGIWWKMDGCDTYVSGTTSHIEGTIAPVVIDGFGEYLLNEYSKCSSIGYDGKYENNSFKCAHTRVGAYVAVLLRSGTANPAEDSDGSPLDIGNYKASTSAWMLQNIFSPWNGSKQANNDTANIMEGQHGYALNDTQTGRTGGSGYIDNSNGEDDLPELVAGVEQRGVVAGWGFMLYRIPVAGRDEITVQLLEGSDKVEILATVDRPIYSTAARWDLNADFASDASGKLVAQTTGKSQLFLFVQLKNEPANGQEVVFYKIKTGTAAAAREIFAGSFSGIGLWSWDPNFNSWSRWNDREATSLAVGDVDGNGKEDLIGTYDVGLWIRLDSGTWQKVAGVSNPQCLAAGDFNGDLKDDVLGSWPGLGVWTYSVGTAIWTRLHDKDALMLGACDFNSDGLDDLLGVWNPEGVWVKYTGGSWVKVLDKTNLVAITTGDMNGDGRGEILGSWTFGVWRLDFATGSWSKLYDMADRLAAGDLDGNGSDDLLGVWPNVAGLWVRYDNGSWAKICDPLPTAFAAGKLK